MTTRCFIFAYGGSNGAGDGWRGSRSEAEVVFAQIVTIVTKYR